MVREDTIEFENDIPNKYNAKNPGFFPEEEVEMLRKRIMMRTPRESTKFFSPTFIITKALWWDTIDFELERVE